MKLFFILLLLISLDSFSQPATVFKVSKVAADCPPADTSVQSAVNGIIGLPYGLNVTNCEIVFTSSSEVFKAYYTQSNPGSWAAMKSFMNRAKPKDKISFVDIYILKEGKRMKWPDKIIEIR